MSVCAQCVDLCDPSAFGVSQSKKEIKKESKQELQPTQILILVIKVCVHDVDDTQPCGCEWVTQQARAC